MPVRDAREESEGGYHERELTALARFGVEIDFSPVPPLPNDAAAAVARYGPDTPVRFSVALR